MKANLSINNIVHICNHKELERSSKRFDQHRTPARLHATHEPWKSTIISKDRGSPERTLEMMALSGTVLLPEKTVHLYSFTQDGS